MSTAIETAKSIVSGLPDAAILLDHTQTMIAFNPLFASLVGLRGQDGVGIAIEPFHLLGVDPEEDTRRAQECFAKRAVIHLAEVTAKTETGVEFVMRVTFLPVLDGPDHAIGVIVLFRDVTDEATLQARYQSLKKQADG